MDSYKLMLNNVFSKFSTDLKGCCLNNMSYNKEKSMVTVYKTSFYRPHRNGIGNFFHRTSQEKLHKILNDYKFDS